MRMCGDTTSVGRPPTVVAMSGIHDDSGVDRPIVDFRSSVSPSRQAGSGECVQGSADRLGSSSSVVQQFFGESGVLLVRLAGARIAARASVLAVAVRRMAVQLENHHQARGGTSGDAHLQFSTTPAVVRQESAQQVNEMAGGGHDQYRRLEKGSSRIGLSGVASPPLQS